MADVNSPKEFLEELLTVSDSLDAAKADLKKYSDSKKQLESSLSGLKNTVEKEKANTVKSRRADLAAGFDKQLKAVDNETKKIKDKRQKALTAEIKKRADAATSGVKQQAVNDRKKLKEYVSSNKLPGVFKTRLYYNIFCPGILGYLILVALFIFIIVGAFVFAKARITAGESAQAFIIIGAADLILLFLYIFIWANTRVKYRDEITECRNMVNSIIHSEKQAKSIEKNIKSAGDDSTYDLSKYDLELTEKAGKRADIEKNRQESLEQFDNETSKSILDGIDAKYKSGLEELSSQIADAGTSEQAASESVSALESRISSEFVSHVGAKNITRPKIEQMIALIESGEASSVSEAASHLEQEKKQ